LRPLIAILFHNSVVVSGFACYSCSSPDSHLEPSQILHLKSQPDIFFYSDRYSLSCNQNLSAQISGTVSIDVCDNLNLCATVQPAFDLAPNETVVHRGCFSSLIRHKFRDRKFLHHNGCYLLRSTPLYDKDTDVDYILCVCSGSYCNVEVPQFNPNL
ncbi:hypothetical protein PFISCL1PPCAC_1906, partial [Pristionchus fissidentatus]